MDWIPVGTPPLSQYLVAVKDEFGNEGLAEAAYYPFTVEYRPGRWKSIIHPCEPYHDGGWMILADKGIESDIVGDIIYWRGITPTP